MVLKNQKQKCMSKSDDLLRKIISLRKAKGYSQQEMADKLNLSYAQYQRKESGTTSLSVACLRRIAAYFTLPLSYFFEQEEYFGGKNCSHCLVYKEQLKDLKNDKIRLQQRVDDLKLGRFS